MLEKIVLSQDRKSARVYFEAHSVGFYHSDGLVMELINEIVIQPSLKLEERYRIADEITVVIEVDLQLSLFKDAA